MIKLKRFLILFLAVFYLRAVFAEERTISQGHERPNIVFILADDQRNDILSCAGHPVVQTPTIDELARKGVRFTNAFVTTPICAASRASIFTGLYERHHGFTFGKPPVSVDHALSSYPALLKKAGYRTAYIGKSHARFQDQDEVFQEMFDAFLPVSKDSYVVEDSEGNYRHETELCGDLAIEFIESNPDDVPFVLSVGFFAAHAVDRDLRLGHHFEPLWETRTKYVEENLPLPKYTSWEEMAHVPGFLKTSISGERWHWRWDTLEKYDSNLRDYYRLISGIDLTVARILEALKKKGLDRNTIIVYSADNGYMMGDRLMAGKWNHYEQSLRVPLIVYDPRQTQPGGFLSSKLALNIDLAPTILDYAGIEIPGHYDGRSLKDLVTGQSVSDWRDAFYCEHRLERETVPRWSGIRTDRYKYAYYDDFGKRGGEFLYDLEKDPGELRNLVKNPDYKGALKEMRGLHKAFLEQIPDASGQ